MNPTFTVSVDLAKRKTSVVGLVAVGEKVNVVISGFGDYSVPEWEPDNTEGFSGAALRFRLVAPDGKDLVRFPLVEGDTWNNDGDSFSAEVDFNTMQLRKWLRGFPIDGKAEVGVIVDSVVDAMEYGRGTVKILQWAASPAEDPTILPDWRETLRDLNAAIVEISSKTERAETAAQAAQTARDDAQTFKKIAETAANNARSSENAARGFKNNAESASTSAGVSANNAASSRTAAESAKSAAESARDEAKRYAESAENTLANAATKAELQAEVERAKDAESELAGRVKTLEDAPPAVEVVPPSLDGAGKAADAKAVYEEMEKKRDKLDLTVYKKNTDGSYVEFPEDCLPIVLDPGAGADIVEIRDRSQIVVSYVDDGDYWHVGIGAYFLIFYTDTGAFWSSPYGSVTFGGRAGVDGKWPVLINKERPSDENLVTSKELSAKQDALNDAQMAAVNSGVTNMTVAQVNDLVPQVDSVQLVLAETVQRVTEVIDKVNRSIPNYPFSNIDELSDGNTALLQPYCHNTLRVLDATAFKVEVALYSYAEYSRDLTLVIPAAFETAPTITWGAKFHPRTDAETDFACVAGKCNVYWITEYASGEFCVAGWQETAGGNAQ